MTKMKNKGGRPKRAPQYVLRHPRIRVEDDAYLTARAGDGDLAPVLREAVALGVDVMKRRDKLTAKATEADSRI